MLCKNLSIIFLSFFMFHFSTMCSEYKSIKNVTKKAYMRAGPGKWYPVKWILNIPDLPLKVLEENGDYYFVEIYDNTKGWVSKKLISKKRNVIVVKDTYVYDKKGEKKAVIKKNVVLKFLDCENKEKYPVLCRVKHDRIDGYIQKDKIWGTTDP